LIKPQKRVSYGCPVCKIEFENVQIRAPGGLILTIGKELRQCPQCRGGLVRHVKKVVKDKYAKSKRNGRFVR